MTIILKHNSNLQIITTYSVLKCRYCISRNACFTHPWSVFKVTLFLSFTSFTMSKHTQQWPSKLNFDRKSDRQQPKLISLCKQHSELQKWNENWLWTAPFKLNNVSYIYRNTVSLAYVWVCEKWLTIHEIGKDEGLSYRPRQATLTQHVTCLNYISSTSGDKKRSKKIIFCWGFWLPWTYRNSTKNIIRGSISLQAWQWNY